jgi:LacI family transcriptional regulator
MKVEREPKSSTGIREVAKLAGVARSSVSRVFSDQPNVSDRMRQKVLKAAAEVGYEPDLLASSLRKGSTKTVGLLLRDISNPLFALVAHACEMRLREAGYAMLIANSGGTLEGEEVGLNLLRRRRVDGVIVSLDSEVAASTLSELSAFTVPVVLIDREVKGIPHLGAVLCDHFTGIDAAVGDILRHGHRRIALITGELDVRSTRERLRGYRHAHKDFSIPVDEDLLSFGSFDSDFAHTEMLRLLSGKHPPTAVITGGIGSSAGAFQAFSELGVRPGVDISMVVLDEWPLFDLAIPSISSVSRNPSTIGSSCAHMLLEMLRGSRPKRVLLETNYTARATVMKV